MKIVVNFTIIICRCPNSDFSRKGKDIVYTSGDRGTSYSQFVDSHAIRRLASRCERSEHVTRGPG